MFVGKEKYNFFFVSFRTHNVVEVEQKKNEENNKNVNKNLYTSIPS